MRMVTVQKEILIRMEPDPCLNKCYVGHFCLKEQKKKRNIQNIKCKKLDYYCV